MSTRTSILLLAAGMGLACRASVPVPPVSAAHGIVVAAHPEAAAIGAGVLRSGGNAIDAAVAVSLAVGVAEPYGSGLGGKLMLLYREAATGRTYAVEAMDACGSALDVATARRLSPDAHSYGYRSVCVPGLAAGLWAAHQRWGAKPWAQDVAPAIALARNGFEVLPKTRDFFDEQWSKLRRGDPEIARLYLVAGELPAVGIRLRNEDLAKTMELLAERGRDGFYRGPVAERIAEASRRGGGAITLADLAGYQARIVDPVAADFRGYRIVSAPPPARGASLFMPVLRAIEGDAWGSGPLRTAASLDRIGRLWCAVARRERPLIGDSPDARAHFEQLMSPESIRAIRSEAESGGAPRSARVLEEGPCYQSPMAATTQWIIVDGAGNIACATQSLSMHFGAGVVPPGTGVVLNDSMSNFDYSDPSSSNFVAPGRRPHSTISPTIVERGGRPLFAIGVPGAARIPTAMLQALIDRLALDRPLAEAIGDTRFHIVDPERPGDGRLFEAEQSLPAEVAAGLRARGWKVALPEEAGRGRHFGGINAIEFNADGSLTGYADPRRTNAAAGY